MTKENQNNDLNMDFENLFIAVIDKISKAAKVEILKYYNERDIIPVLKDFEKSGRNLKTLLSTETLKELENHKASKKQEFPIWRLNRYGKLKQ